MKKIHFAMAAILTFSLLLTGCSSTGTLLDSGIKSYSSGKPTLVITDPNTIDEINRLLDAYTSGIQERTVKEVTPSDTDPTSTDPTSADPTSGTAHETTRETTGASETTDNSKAVKTLVEVRQILRDALKSTQTNLYFVTDGLQVTLSDFIEILSADDTYEEAIDSLEFNSITYSSKKTTGDYTLYSVQLTYGKSVNEVIEEKAKIRQKVEEINTALQLDTLDNYDKTVAIDNYLCETVTYPDGDGINYPAIKHTAYGALIDGSAVCDGYSRAAQLLFLRSGVECLLVIGVCTNGIGHAWNMVKLDGSWYHLDVTWDDGSLSKDYFLVTDAFMQQSRTWDTTVFPASAEGEYMAA